MESEEWRVYIVESGRVESGEWRVGSAEWGVQWECSECFEMSV